MNKKQAQFATMFTAQLTGKRYIANLIDMYLVDWQARGKFVMPNLRDGADFLVTEVGELIEAILRQNPDYVRNHSRKFVISKELADVVIMAHVVAAAAGVDLTAAIEDKLEEMDKKRSK